MMTENDRVEFNQLVQSNGMFDRPANSFSMSDLASVYYAARRTQAEQVRELVGIEQAARELMDECEGTGIFEEWLKIEPLADRLFAALAQQDQPAGEWITISEDGSNLPEHVAGAEWYCCWRDPTVGLLYDWEKMMGEDHIRPPLPTIAYWSIPHIDRRPDTPAYTGAK